MEEKNEKVDESTSNTTVAESAVIEDSSYTEQEKLAMSKGWKPRDQFDGDVSEWRSAKEFNDRGDLLDKIHELSRKNRKNDELIGNMYNQFTSLAARVAAEKEANLKKELAEAISTGNTPYANQKAQELLNHKDEIVKSTVTVNPSQQAAAEAGRAFIVKNVDWWGKDQELTDYAKFLDQKLANENQYVSHEDRLNVVETAIRDMIAKKSGTKTMDTPAKPASHVQPSEDAKPFKQPSDSKELTFANLTEDEKDFYKAFEKSAGTKFNAKSYLKTVMQLRKAQ